MALPIFQQDAPDGRARLPTPMMPAGTSWPEPLNSLRLSMVPSGWVMNRGLLPGRPASSGDSTLEALATGPRNPLVTYEGVGLSTITVPAGACSRATRAVAM